MIIIYHYHISLRTSIIYIFDFQFDSSGSNNDVSEIRPITSNYLNPFQDNFSSLAFAFFCMNEPVQIQLSYTHHLRWLS